MIDLYSSSANLGDNLGMTPLIKTVPCRLHMIDLPSCRVTAPVFEGLCEVVFDNGTGENPRSSEDLSIYGPPAKRFLVRAGLWGRVQAIPSVRVTKAEADWARAFLAPYPNPCAIRACPQFVNDRRTPPKALLERVIAANPEVTFLTFVPSKLHIKGHTENVDLPGVKIIYDLTVRQLAAVYHVIGRLVAPDTGDYHLMLAVGGRCDVLVPPHAPIPGYDHGYYLYGRDCWIDESPRVAYHTWTEPLNPFTTGLNT